MIIDLTKPGQLPKEFAARLKRLESLCRELEFSEELVAQKDVYSLVKDIDYFCTTQKVVGIHYTRAMPESIRKNGLLIRSGDEIRATFLEEHGYLFTKSEIITINELWKSYFKDSQSSARDGRVFFNFTESALNTSGTKYLLGLYGGEQVNMCFELDDPIGEKLGSIGVPLVVQCALDPNMVRTFIEYPWGKILVSAYHLMVNSEAYGIDQDGYQTDPVKFDDIIKIRVLTNRSSQTQNN